MDKLNIELKSLIENEDGSADLLFNVDEKTVKFLCEYALNDILKKQIEKLEVDDNEE